MDHRPAKINPDGFIAQHLTWNGETRWVLTAINETGLWVALQEDNEVANWPDLKHEEAPASGV